MTLVSSRLLDAVAVANVAIGCISQLVCHFVVFVAVVSSHPVKPHVCHMGSAFLVQFI